MTTEELAGEGLGDDVAEVELGRALVEVDGFDLLGAACNGVAHGHPLRLGRGWGRQERSRAP